MAVRIYTSREVQKIYDSGMISFETHMLLRRYLRPGISTWELNKIAQEYIESKGAKPAFLGLYGYPACLCTSVNDTVVHGLPKKECILKEGDIISIDLGVLFNGYYSDTAWTWPVGEIQENARKLIQVTQECLFRGISQAVVGNRIGAISEAIQTYAEAHGYGVVRQLVGHGVGKSMHEEPQVPNFGKKRDGMKIRQGMVLAIEPMINEGTFDVYTDSDNWSIRTKDGRLSAHFEHTVAVTAHGPLICTLPKGAKIDVFALMAEVI